MKPILFVKESNYGIRRHIPEPSVDGSFPILLLRIDIWEAALSLRFAPADSGQRNMLKFSTSQSM